MKRYNLSAGVGMLAWGLACLVFSAAIEAATWVLPNQTDPAFSVNLPGTWSSEQDDGTVTTEDPEDQAFAILMAWEPGSERQAIKDVKALIAETAGKVKFPEPIRFDRKGLTGLEFKVRTVLEEEGISMDIRAAIYALPDEKYGLVLAMVQTAAGRSVKAAVEGIFHSVMPHQVALAGAAPEHGDRPRGPTPAREDSVRPGLSDAVTSALQALNLAGDGVKQQSADGPAADGKGPSPVDQQQEQEQARAKDTKGEDGLAPGRWKVLTPFNDVIYSSLLIATATLRDDEDPDPQILGDDLGMVGVAIHSPREQCPVEVEVSSPNYIKTSRFVGVLPRAGATYTVFPVLSYDYNQLLAVRQTVPETLNVKVLLDGKPAGEESLRAQIRPINEVLFGFEDEDGVTDMSWMFAAYVNENHPFIDEILRDALNAGEVKEFAGYQKDPEGVRAEIRAIWQALKKRGFRYSNVTTTSSGEDDVYTQNVRLMSDALRTSQANCVDGSVLIASILRKLGLQVYLVTVPGHMLVAVDLDEDGEKTIGIETTLLGDRSFAEAVKAGQAQIEEVGDRFEDPDDMEHQMIDVAEARRMGVIPIRDVASEASAGARR